MSTDKSAAAIRELAEKWGYLTFDYVETSCTEEFLSDLTALIAEHYVSKEDAGYPKKFLLWGIWSCPFDVEKVDGITLWIDRDLNVRYTLDELFNYWEENER